MRKKVLSIVLAVLLCAALMPTGAAAAKVAKSGSFRVTISDAGELVESKTGKLVVDLPVTAYDLNKNNKISIDEVLIAAHDTYAEGGSEAGYASAEGRYGLSIQKLWGDTSGAFGFCVNGITAQSLDDKVPDGALVTAFIYGDRENWSDSYSYFTCKKTNFRMNENVEVTLHGQFYDMTTGMCEQGAFSGATVFALEDEHVATLTDENGVASLRFSTPGTYTLVSYGNGVVPNVCTITVDGFKDVKKGSWYYDAVMTAVSKGLFSGVTATEFGPNQTMTRGMFVTVLYSLQGKPDVSSVANPFSDVKSSDWYYNAVMWAYSEGIVSGTGAKTFSPNQAVTRQQIMLILFGYAELLGRDISARNDLSGYADFTDIDLWALKAMEWGNAAGLISGCDKDHLAPQDPATRAEVAVIMMKFINGIS